MVDWKGLYESWEQVSDDLKKKLVAALLSKTPDQLKELFLREPYAKMIWNRIPEDQRFPKEVSEVPDWSTIWASWNVLRLGKTEIPEAKEFLSYWEKKHGKEMGYVEGRPQVTVEDWQKLVSFEKLLDDLRARKLPTAAPVEVRKVMETIKPPAPAPRPTKILGSEDMRRLQDLWNNEFFRSLGRVPPNSTSTFRVEFEKVKDKTFEEAKEAILGVANDIISEFGARETVRRAAPFREQPAPRIIFPEFPEEGAGRPGEAEVAPSVPIRTVMPKPLSEMPFPRAPSHNESDIMWENFLNAVSEVGKNPIQYRTVFAERMGLSYRSWEALLGAYEQLLRDIQTGSTVSWISIAHTIAMPWREDTEEHWREDAILHLTSIKLYKNPEDLIYSRPPEGSPGLESYGVPNVTEEEVKQVIKKAWKEKSHWLLTISKEWLEAFIGEPLE